MALGAAGTPTLEFEGMVKVFFADGGTLEQLRANLRTIAETADERYARLWRNVEEAIGPDAGFAERQHLSSLGVRFHLQHEQLVADWARWALGQTEGWDVDHRPGPVGPPPALAGLRRPDPAG